MTEVQWRGATHRLHVQVDDASVLVDATAMHVPPEVGQRLNVRFAAEDAILMPAAQAHD